MTIVSWGMSGPSLVELWDLKIELAVFFVGLGEMSSDHEVLTSSPLRLRQVRSLVSFLFD